MCRSKVHFCTVLYLTMGGNKSTHVMSIVSGGGFTAPLFSMLILSRS
jgi:hypothetical protein